MTKENNSTAQIISNTLASVSLFKKIQETTLEGLRASATLQTLKKGNILFLQDDEATSFYVVTSGWIKLFRETVEGEEAVIDILSIGDVFGETAILENDTHTFCAMAVEPTSVMRIPSHLLKKAIEEDNSMAVAMLGSLAKYRKRQTREIEGLTLQNASQRIGCFMLRLCYRDDTGPVQIRLPYDKSLIAARLGMKSETFSRALNKLRKETGIEIKGPVVNIPAVPTLASYACSACSNEFPCSELTNRPT